MVNGINNLGGYLPIADLIDVDNSGVSDTPSEVSQDDGSAIRCCSAGLSALWERIGVA